MFYSKSTPILVGFHFSVKQPESHNMWERNIKAYSYAISILQNVLHSLKTLTHFLGAAHVHVPRQCPLVLLFEVGHTILV